MVTPHNYRLTALCTSNLPIFRYLAQKLLEGRKYSCVVSIQSSLKAFGIVILNLLFRIMFKSKALNIKKRKQKNPKQKNFLFRKNSNAEDILYLSTGIIIRII